MSTQEVSQCSGEAANTPVSSAFLARVLEPPRYSFVTADGQINRPSHREIFSEFFYRLNFLRTKKNWMPAMTWAATLGLAAFFFIFVFNFFSWTMFFGGLAYAMICLGTYGTIYLHRFSTHRAYQFKNGFAQLLCRNMAIKVLPEEIYVVSHHVHHSITDLPGDPYNAKAGWLFCFLADVNHQPIAKDLNETDYKRIAALMKHTGVKVNTYEQYLTWGSVAHPARTAIHFLLNWGFWFGVLYLIGGFTLATGIFGMSAIWAFGVRTYNYDGHGGGKDKHQTGIDFNLADTSINQIWPGYVAGEWHNNHHLYPNGARSGFLPYQLDLAWEFIRFYHKVGGISCYRDYKAEFLTKYYHPYLAQQKAPRATEPSVLPCPLIAAAVVKDVAPALV